MKLLSTSFLSLLAIGLLAIAAAAQTTSENVVLLTWRANTYTPWYYQGKALITTGSEVSFSVAVLSDGKPAALENQVVRWYEQGRLTKTGIGMQVFATQANLLPGNDLKIRVELPEFPGGSISKTISVRVVSPKVVVELPFSNLQTTTRDITARAVPYFFSVFTENSLNYQWSINDTPLASGDTPQTATVPARSIIESGIRSLVFRVSAENPDRYVDKAVGEKTVGIQGLGQ